MVITASSQRQVHWVGGAKQENNKDKELRNRETQKLATRESNPELRQVRSKYQ